MVEEYRALYGLLLFRLAAVDRQLPFVGGILGAVLGSLSALPRDTRLVLLLALPMAFIWLMRMTVSHARSKEDVLRRIDEIERQVNQVAGEELLAFQSRHPNRGRVVSGRSGRGSMLTMLAFCLMALLVCGQMLAQIASADDALALDCWIYVGLAAADLLYAVWRLTRYRYRKPPAEACPLFVGRDSG